MQASAFINTPLKVYLNHIRLTSMLCIYMLPVIKPFIYTQTYTMSPLYDKDDYDLIANRGICCSSGIQIILLILSK